MPHHKSTGVLSAWCLIWDFILTEGSTETAPSALRFIFPSHLPASHCLSQRSQICFPLLDLVSSQLHFNPACAAVIPLTLLKQQEALGILLLSSAQQDPLLTSPSNASLHPQVLASRSSGAITGNITPHRALHTGSLPTKRAHSLTMCQIGKGKRTRSERSGR